MNVQDNPICEFCSFRYPRGSRSRKYCSTICRSRAQTKPDPEKRKIILKRYYEKHKAECIKRNLEWQSANREKVNAIQREYYKRHQDEIRQKAKRPEVRAKVNIRRKQWKLQNLDKVSAENARQHNRKKFNGVRFHVLERDGFTCYDCFKLGGSDMNVHHLDGSGQTKEPNNDMENLVTLCLSCHMKRHRSFEWNLIKGIIQSDLDLRI